MSRRKLSFYDHHRQNYHAAVWRPDHDAVVGEFMVGDYVKGGGVDERGELRLVLYHFKTGMYNKLEQNLSVQIQCFSDAYGTLRELDRLGVLRAIEMTKISTRDELSGLLLAYGLRDRSDSKVKEVTA